MYKADKMVEKKASTWVKDFMKDTFKHMATKGKPYNISIEGLLRNEIVRDIVNTTFIKCEIKGDISNLKYKRLNRRSVGQEEGVFKIRKKNKMRRRRITRRIIR